MAYSDETRRRGYRSDRVERVVAEAFEVSILPMLEDPLLADLHVVRVEVARNLARVCVVVAPGSACAGRDEAAVEEALERAAGRMRMDLAELIAIKRVPALVMRYLPLPLWSDSPDRSGRETGKEAGADENH